MAINYTNLLGLAKPVTGTESNTWGDVVNDQITELVEEAIAGSVALNVTAGNVTLTDTQGSANQARASALVVSGSPGTTRNIIAPSRDKTYVVINGSDSSVVVKGSATTGATVTSGTRAVVSWNGSDFVVVAGSVVSLTSQVTGTLPVTNGGTGVASVTSGALLLGNGSSPLSALVGSSVGQIPQWSGTAWTVGSLPSTGVVSVSASFPLASSGGSTPNISLSGTVPVASGGTGQTTYSNGQLLIGNSSGGLSRATLTEGSGISITNGSGAITISAIGGTGLSSFGLSGGTTGLSFSPSTINTSGTTSTLSGTLSTANGGTGVAAASLDAAGIVTKAGAQSISGVKTFTTNFNVASSSGINDLSGAFTLNGFLSLTSNSPIFCNNFNNIGGSSDPFKCGTVFSNRFFFSEPVGIQKWTGDPNAVAIAASSVERYVGNASGFFPSQDNSFILGSSTNRWAAIWAATGSIQTSDARQKTEVVDSALGLGFIKSLRPVSYKWIVGGSEVEAKYPPESLPKDERNCVIEYPIDFGASISTPVPGRRTHYGLIAQEVKRVLGDVDFGGYVYDSETDQHALRYDQFIAPLIKAVQELTSEVEALRARIAALESA